MSFFQDISVLSRVKKSRFLVLTKMWKMQYHATLHVIDSEGVNAGGQISTDRKYKGINVFIPSQMQCIRI